MADQTRREPRSAEPHHLKLGAVAIIDALGFRGVWRTHRGALVLRRLHAVKQAIEETASRITETLAISTPVFLSDTVLLTVGADRGNPESETLAIQLASALALTAVHEAIDEEIDGPAFTFRGCVAFGEVLAEGPFVVGPAIDEAAEWYEKAQAALIWLLPSATKRAQLEAAAYMSWAVPLKEHGTVETVVLNPMARAWGLGDESIEQRRARMVELKRVILGSFTSDRVDVVAKRQATEKFLDAGIAHCERVGRR